jgi:single-strand DNA-binding protein
MQLLGSRDGGGTAPSDDGGYAREREREPMAARAPGGAGAGGGAAPAARKPAHDFDDMDDDIPF